MKLLLSKSILKRIPKSRSLSALLIALRLDQKINMALNAWHWRKLEAKKSLEENMGFSSIPEVQETLKRIKVSIMSILPEYGISGPILDVGCGVGLYLSEFPSDISLYGVDLSESFIEAARHRIPMAKLSLGDYLTVHFPEQFAYIYSVGVVQYIAPSQLSQLVEKLYKDLLPGGIVLLQYPHAISESDLSFSDLGYCQYSPIMIKNKFSQKFTIAQHYHCFDGRPSDFDYDRIIYHSHLERSLSNGSILVCQKDASSNSF